MHVPGRPEQVIDLLTDPRAISRWSPVPFEVLDLDGERLAAGRKARVRGQLAGRDLEFVVDVLAVDAERLSLVADGPISLDVEYHVAPARGGSDVRASVGVRGRGPIGRLLANAAGLLLGAGALRSGVSRLARELEPAMAV
jgi:hypothetical protein